MIMSKEIVWAMQGAINHWWSMASVGRMGVAIPEDEVPFWVSTLLDELRDSVGIEFDIKTGVWDGEV